MICNSILRYITFLVLFVPFLANAQFKVVGYMPSWAGNVGTVQYSKLTHINYAFLLPTNTGGLQAIENPSKLQSLVSTAHANGVKVMISVGGWNNGNDGGFESLAANSTYRQNFVTNIMNFVNQYNLDGADIDWEYPDAGASANNYVTLMTMLSNSLHNQGKLLTAAVVGNNGGSILSSVFPLVDFLTIMAYDANNFEHSTYNFAVTCLNYWRNRGLPKEKAILGVPFYARPSWKGYNQLLNEGASPNSDYFGSDFYNGLPTMRQKTNLAFDNGGGVMIWELSQDVNNANSLLSAIHEVKLQRTGNPPNPNIPANGSIIWLRGNNGRYVSGENGTQAMTCTRTTAGTWENFSVWNQGSGKVALRSMGKYMSSENGVAPMNCDRATIGGWEQFTWVANSNGTISLRGSNNQYVSSENGAQAMTCSRPAIGGWEQFNFGIVSAAAAAQTLSVAKQDDASGEVTEFTVYPSPVPQGGNLQVSLPRYDATSPVLISVKNVSGQEVINRKEQSNKFAVPLGNAHAGVYIISAVNGVNQYSKKFIVR